MLRTSEKIKNPSAPSVSTVASAIIQAPGLISPPSVGPPYTHIRSTKNVPAERDQHRKRARSIRSKRRAGLPPRSTRDAQDSDEVMKLSYLRIRRSRLYCPMIGAWRHIKVVPGEGLAPSHPFGVEAFKAPASSFRHPGVSDSRLVV